jgi:hypothetical protein
MRTAARAIRMGQSAKRQFRRQWQPAARAEAPAKWKTDYRILLLHSGQPMPEDVRAAEVARTRALHWVVRIGLISVIGGVPAARLFENSPAQVQALRMPRSARLKRKPPRVAVLRAARGVCPPATAYRVHRQRGDADPATPRRSDQQFQGRRQAVAPLAQEPDRPGEPADAVRKDFDSVAAEVQVHHLGQISDIAGMSRRL